MKLIVSSAELLKGILAVSKAIPAKSALPILENFLFDLKGNSLEITASDMELTLKTSLEVDNAVEEGRIAIPARHMTDLLKELPDQPLTISTLNDSSFECSWANGSSTLPYLSCAKSRIFIASYDHVPLFNARPTTPPPSVPGNISGKMVSILKCILTLSVFAIFT